MKKIRYWKLYAGAVVILMISFWPCDPHSEAVQTPPPYSYLEALIQNKQPKLDPTLTKVIAESVYKNSKEFLLPPELIIALMERESLIIPTSTSKADCIGLMQVNPKAHKEKMVGIDIVQLYYVDNNVKIGCQILKEYLNETKSITGALKKYLGAENKEYMLDILSTFTDSILIAAE